MQVTKWSVILNRFHPDDSRTYNVQGYILQNITEHLKTTIPFRLPTGSFNIIDKGSNLRFGTYLEGADVNGTHVSIWVILVVQQPADKKQ